MDAEPATISGRAADAAAEDGDLQLPPSPPRLALPLPGLFPPDQLHDDLGTDWLSLDLPLGQELTPDMSPTAAMAGLMSPPAVSLTGGGAAHAADALEAVAADIADAMQLEFTGVSAAAMAAAPRPPAPLHFVDYK